MRRVVALVASCALLLAPAFAASAANLPQGNPVDLGSQLMLQLFGETSDTGASFAAARGDRASESPLRELALGARSSGAKPIGPVVAEAFAQDRFALRDLAADQGATAIQAVRLNVLSSVSRFALPPTTNDASVVPPDAHFTAAYQPVAQPSISPGPGTLAFAPPQIETTQFTPSATQLDAAAQHALSDTLSGAGSNFDIQAGNRNVNVNLTTAYAHVGANDGQAFAAPTIDTNAPWQLSTLGAPLALPSAAELNRLSLGAGFSVPVVRGLTLNLNYNAERISGTYGATGLLNLDAMNDSYGGKLTFAIPRSSSSLSIGAYQDRFGDGMPSLGGQTQTREDVNFTVKF